jgi:hypothetical protein
MKEATAAGLLLGFVLFAMASGDEDTPDETDEVVAACFDSGGDVKIIDTEAECPEKYPNRIQLLSDVWQPDMPEIPEIPPPPDLEGTFYDYYVVSQPTTFESGSKGNSVVTRDCRRKPGGPIEGDVITGGGYRLIPPAFEWKEDPPIEITSSRSREAAAVNGIPLYEWMVSIHIDRPLREPFSMEVYAICARVK